MSCRIPLTQGRVALVDEADYDQIKRHAWFYSKTGYTVDLIPINGKSILGSAGGPHQRRSARQPA